MRSGETLVAYLRGIRKGKQPYPDLVVLSPGPGNPGDFGLSDTIREVGGRLWSCFAVRMRPDQMAEVNPLRISVCLIHGTSLRFGRSCILSLRIMLVRNGGSST